MVQSLVQAVLNEYRSRRMARFAVWWLAFGLALWLAARFTKGLPGVLWVAFWGVVIALVFYYVGRGVGFIRHRLLWPVRRRLVVTYVFIAVVPIILILALVAIGGYLLSGQFAAYLVASKLRDRAEELRQLNRAVAHLTYETHESSPQNLLALLHRYYVTELSQHASSYPGLEVTIRVGTLTRAIYLDGRTLEKPASLPLWLNREEFSGIVADQGRLALRAVQRSETRFGQLALFLSEPLTPELLQLVGAGIGPVEVVGPGLRELEQGRAAPTLSSLRRLPRLPEATGRFDFEVYGASTLDPVIWGGESEQRLTEPVFVVVNSRIVTLNRQLLSTLGEFSHIYVVAFVVIALIFLVIELFSLIVGIRLTQSITTTVDRIQSATERVKSGDITYRIRLPARDQLSALGESFDGMTASLELLLRESREKSRLEGEIAIAREVQQQLFPQTVPQVAGLQLYGICKPARAVSGDYYDFLQLGHEQLGLVLGDVSGKGISAALLMATIQSALHAQLVNGTSTRGSPGGNGMSAAEVVARLNRQLFASTPVEQYATFFYAVYDAMTRKVTYTNAGHVPPVLFRRGSVERLKTGGTVVGLFSPVDYEQGELTLEPGDLLLAFTDGAIEPENTYGEEFGEARLLEVAGRALNVQPELLVEEICRNVIDWTGSAELPDDMTMIVAKAMA